jgi:TRAP-type C4-dicarboxylate transport system substrate-binding protein
MILGGAITAMATAVAGCGSTGSSGSGGAASGAGSLADMEPVTFKVATLYGPDNWQSVPMNDFTKAIEEESNGKIEFEFYYGAALVAPDEIADGLRDGLVDLAYFVQVYTPAKFPTDDWISKAAFLSEPDPVGGHLQAISATADWAINDEDFMAEFDSQGLTALIPRVQVIHDYNLLCKEPVTSLSDARGKKVRIGGAAWAAAAENIGMSPVSLAGDEIYTGLQQGVVNCFMGGAADMAGLNLTELAKNYTPMGFTGFSSYAIAMGSSAWEGLPVEAQQLIWDQIPTYLESFAQSSNAAVDDFYTAAEEQGVNLLEPDQQLAAKAEQHKVEVLAALPDEAPDAVTDPEATLSSFEDAHEKWEGIIEELGLFDIPVEDISTVEPAEWAERTRTEVFEPHRPE